VYPSVGVCSVGVSSVWVSVVCVCVVCVCVGGTSNVECTINLRIN
jgi:hypothetical protein